MFPDPDQDIDATLSAAVSDFWTDDDSDYATSHSMSDAVDLQWYTGSRDASRSGSASDTPTASGSRNESRSITPVLSPMPLSPPIIDNERLTVEQVMSKYTGTDTASLRTLTTGLARECIFGRDEMAKKSLSGRKNTDILDKAKVDYIKALVRSRVPEKSQVEFEHAWTLCRNSLSKSCQTLRNSARKKQQ